MPIGFWEFGLVIAIGAYAVIWLGVIGAAIATSRKKMAPFKCKRCYKITHHFAECNWIWCSCNGLAKKGR